MEDAIYARYSTCNQRYTSIEDQVSACLQLAHESGSTISENRIYIDYAKSGTRLSRQGLDRLLLHIENGEIANLFVYSQSRLARDSLKCLMLLKRATFKNVIIKSVADHIDTSQEYNKLYSQLISMVDESQIDAIRVSSIRGIVETLKRGFSVGPLPFGYESYVMENIENIATRSSKEKPFHGIRVNEAEAKIVRDIFLEFAEGKSGTAIAKRLNAEGIFKKQKGTWTARSVYSVLRNVKYIGVFCWGITTRKYDPITEKRTDVVRAEGPLVTVTLKTRIITEEVWATVQARLKEVEALFASGEKGKGFVKQKKSEVMAFPKDLFSGMMLCGECKKTFGLVSGSHGGYYGCLTSKLHRCSNKITVRKDVLEEVIVSTISNHLKNPNDIDYIFQKVKRNISAMLRDIPSEITTKRNKLKKVNSKLCNLVDFVSDGKGTTKVKEAIEEYEIEAQKLRCELDRLEAAQTNVFTPPSKDNITEAVSDLLNTLKLHCEQSALVLRDLLGTIIVNPITPEIGKPYLQATCKLRVWMLLKGTNSIQLRSQPEWIRNIAEIGIKVALKRDS